MAQHLLDVVVGWQSVVAEREQSNIKLNFGLSCFVFYVVTWKLHCLALTLRVQNSLQIIQMTVK